MSGCKQLWFSWFSVAMKLAGREFDSWFGTLANSTVGMYQLQNAFNDAYKVGHPTQYAALQAVEAGRMRQPLRSQSPEPSQPQPAAPPSTQVVVYDADHEELVYDMDGCILVE